MTPGMPQLTVLCADHTDYRETVLETCYIGGDHNGDDTFESPAVVRSVGMFEDVIRKDGTIGIQMGAPAVHPAPTSNIAYSIRILGLEKNKPQCDPP